MLHIILNEHGGSKRAVKTFETVKKILDEKSVQYEVLIPSFAGEATQIAKRLLDETEGVINLIVIGGDGTINEVINGITDFSRVRFGLIPAGSGNDFARGLGIKKNTKLAVDRILNFLTTDKKEKMIDIGKTTLYDSDGNVASTRRFGISSGAGLDALVCKKVDASSFKKVLNKLRIGNLAYIIFTIISLFTMDYEDVTVKYDEESESVDISFGKMIFMACMNMPCEGGGVAMAPKADHTDGKLSMCIGHDISRFKAFFALPRLSAGKHEKLKAFTLFDAGAVELKAAHPVVIHADGECLGTTDHVRMEIIEEKLPMIV